MVGEVEGEGTRLDEKGRYRGGGCFDIVFGYELAPGCGSVDFCAEL